MGERQGKEKMEKQTQVQICIWGDKGREEKRQK